MTPLSHCSSRHSSSSLPASTLLPPFRASESVNPNVVMEVFTRRQQQTSERNYRLISTSLAHEIQGGREASGIFFSLLPSPIVIALCPSLSPCPMSIRILLSVKGDRGSCLPCRVDACGLRGAMPPRSRRRDRYRGGIFV